MAWMKVAKDTVALLSAEAGRNAYDRRLSRGTSREGVRSADRQRSRNVVGVYQLVEKGVAWPADKSEIGAWESGRSPC